MTHRHLATLRVLLMLGDATAAVTTFLIVAFLRFGTDPSARWSVGIHPGLVAAAFSAVWVAVFWFVGLYRLRARWSLAADVRDVAKATFITAGVAAALLYFSHQGEVSRVLFVFLFIAQGTISITSRFILRLWFAAQRGRGRNASYMLVVGDGSLARAFAEAVERRAALGIRVVGFLSVPQGDVMPVEGTRPPGWTSRRPILGTIAELQDVFHNRVIDEVGVCLPPAASHLLEPVVALAASEGKTVRVPSDAEESVLNGALQEEFEGFLVRSVVHDGQREVELVAKRLVDIIGAAAGLILLSPLLIATAVAIRIVDGSPVLFQQVRVGRHGRPFTILKFRSMVADAETQFASLAADSDTSGAAFKLEHDPRVTRLGRFLRASSIDELPQLLNVLRGEMSLVGPRPAPPREVQLYDIWHRRRLSMRPGMTGLWQVQSRIDEHFDARAELDLRYIDQWSIWTDLAILLRTIPAVLVRPGR